MSLSHSNTVGCIKVISEIERYIVLPGQATAYKVGMMKILEVREKAKRALGDAFVLGELNDHFCYLYLEG